MGQISLIIFHLSDSEGWKGGVGEGAAAQARGKKISRPVLVMSCWLNEGRWLVIVDKIKAERCLQS